MLNLGFGSGHIKGDRGSISSKNLASLITTYYKMQKKSIIGDYSVSSLKYTVSRYNRNEKPMIGYFKASSESKHFMVIAGYYDITVEYKNKKSDKKYSTEKKRCYIVNDGYHFARGTKSGRVQYINEEYLKAIVKMY